MLMYVVSFLDRANIGFAKEALHTSVGISEAAYALAAGLFFVSYSLLGFPSNLILHKIGAKVWISVLMVAWGLVSMSTMLVTGSVSFYALRLLLGATEAGFFPGVILYLTYWFPNRVRGQMLGLFYLGVPLAMIVGSPLSGFLLEMVPVPGLRNWQWMFLVEGFMAVAVGCVAYWLLDNRPATAKWLPPAEKQALIEALSREEKERRSSGPAELLPMLRDLRVLEFLLIYTLIQIGVYGVVFYLPTEVGALMHRPAGLLVGLVAAIPWVSALAAVFWLPRIADNRGNHRPMAAWIMLVAGFASFAFPTAGPLVGLITLSLAVASYISVQPLFWTLPTGYLADRAAAGGIAVITMGNLGGFIAPNIKVWADVHFHSPIAGLYLLATFSILNAGLIVLTKPSRSSKARQEV
jgi:MFS family permease